MMILVHTDVLFVDFIQEYSDYHCKLYRFFYIEHQLETGEKYGHVVVYSKDKDGNWCSESEEYLPCEENLSWSSENQSVKEYVMEWVDSILDGSKECSPITLYRNVWNEGQYHSFG